MMRRWRRWGGVLGGRRSAPLPQRLFATVGGVERMVTQHTWLGLSDGHVQHSRVVLVPRRRVRRTRGEAELGDGWLAGSVVIGDGGDVRHTRLKAGTAATAATATHAG